MAQFSETKTYEINCPACECDRVIKGRAGGSVGGS